ncbi:MAG: hypothetical protein Q9180_003894 [Flavoplaca navasiana]
MKPGLGSKGGIASLKLRVRVHSDSVGGIIAHTAMTSPKPSSFQHDIEFEQPAGIAVALSWNLSTLDNQESSAIAYPERPFD